MHDKGVNFIFKVLEEFCEDLEEPRNDKIYLSRNLGSGSENRSRTWGNEERGSPHSISMQR